MIFSEEKIRFYKEQDNKMYGVMSYFLSKTITEIPIQIILSNLVFLVTYWATGLDTSSNDKYFYYILTLFLAGYSGSTFAVFAASLFDNKDLIPAIFPLIIYTQVQAAGYFVSSKNIPYVFYLFKYISLYRYTYQSLSWNEFSNLTPEGLDCKIPQLCRLPTDDFPEGMLWSLMALVILSVCNNLLAATALKIRVYMRKVK